jgi:hypothetical protein
MRALNEILMAVGNWQLVIGNCQKLLTAGATALESPNLLTAFLTANYQSPNANYPAVENLSQS